MPEIGSTLREARVRQRLDITQIEADTKIRAKYLRALENEEWDLLPGPTYVKTFLRTYAEALGLDARLLVEEYKLRHERLSDIELQPIAPRRVGDSGGGGRRRRPGPLVPRGAVVVVVLAGIVGLLAFIGREDSGQEAERVTPPTTVEEEPRGERTTTTRTDRKRRRRRTARRSARLRIEPTGPISVCLRARGGRTLIDDQILINRSETFRSSRFLLRVGNGEARLRINGRVRRLRNADVAGYEIRRDGRLRRLARERWPDCS